MVHICKTPPKSKSTPKCSQHTLIFKLKCAKVYLNTPKHSKHPKTFEAQKHSKHPKAFETPQNIRNTAKTFKTPPQHSKHPHNIRTDTRTRADGHERPTRKTDSCGKDGQLWKRWALMEKTGIKHLRWLPTV